MDGLEEYTDDPLRWIIGLLEETAQTNGRDLTPELAQQYLIDNWQFIVACFEEEGLNPPDLAVTSAEVAGGWA